MECAICYCDVSRSRTLVCNHTYCSDCIKSWYLKGTGSGCPMCRRPMYFKGFTKLRDTWDDDAHETKCTELFNEMIEECILSAFETAGMFPNKYRKIILEEALEELCESEKTFQVLKRYGYSIEDIDFVINETDAVISPRWKTVWYDDPVIEKATQYPNTLSYIYR